MKTTISTLVATSTLALLTACGGDGGDDKTSPPPSHAAVAITSTNQSDVARASVNSGLSVAMAQGALSSGQTATTDAAGRAHAMSALVRQALASAGRKAAAGVDSHAEAVHPSTDNCFVSGTLTSSWDDKDGNNLLSAGDVITTTFAQCHQSATNAANGTVVLTLASSPVVTDTTSQLAVNAQFQTLAVTNDGSTYTINGLVAVAENDNDTTSTSSATLTVGAGGLGVNVASTGYSDTLAFAQGLVVNTVMAYDGSTGSVSIAGTLSSSRLGGNLTLSTPVALSGPGSDPYPSSGQLLITGASGSKLRATVLNNAQVKLEVDANGDGTYESNSTVAWTTLVP